MRKSVIGLCMMLAACAAELEPEGIESAEQEVVEACPNAIGAYNTGLAGWSNAEALTWTLVPGSNLNDNWCPYYRSSGVTYLWWQIPAGGDCSKTNATTWSCWAPGWGPYPVWCPTGIRPQKPFTYRPSATWLTPWRSDWTTYENSVPTVNPSSSLKESAGGGLRLRCDYTQLGTLWFWRP